MFFSIIFELISPSQLMINLSSSFEILDKSFPRYSLNIAHDLSSILIVLAEQ